MKLRTRCGHGKRKIPSEFPLTGFFVPRTGIEPARLAAHAPETCASTYSATWAYFSAKYSEQKIGFKPLRIYSDWCPEQDSNLHAVNRHYPLKVACLPISPSGLKYLCAAEIEVQSLNFKGKTTSRDHPRAVCLPSTNLKLTTNLNEPKTTCAKIRHQ